MSPRSGEATSDRALLRLRRREDLDPESAREVAQGFLDGCFSPSTMRNLLVEFARKGESEEEVYAFASALRERARPFQGPRDAGAVDLCGTGGAPFPTFNISTVSSFVVSGAGAPVAKHGNVSARGPCGSSDLLEALGLPIRYSISFAEESWRSERIAFLHAPLYHTATRQVGPVRKEIGGRTVFNLLGPLTNPASVSSQLVGSYSKDYARLAVPLLHRLGVPRVLGVHGGEGADELTSNRKGWVLHGLPEDPARGREGEVEPSRFLSRDEMAGDLRPRPPGEAAQLALDVLRGGGDGAVRGSVLLTSGAALWVQGRVPGLKEGVEMAKAAIQDGAAVGKLHRLQELARSRPWAKEGP